MSTTDRSERKRKSLARALHEEPPIPRQDDADHDVDALAATSVQEATTQLRETDGKRPKTEFAAEEIDRTERRLLTPSSENVRAAGIDEVAVPQLRELKLDASFFSVEKRPSQRVYSERKEPIVEGKQVPEAAAESVRCLDVKTADLTNDKLPKESSEEPCKELYRTGVHRCEVVSVNRPLPQRHVNLTATLIETGETVEVELHGSWGGTPLEKGDPVNLISSLSRRDDGVWCTRIDLNDGYLILCPDILISGSQVPVGSSCIRRAYLSEMLSERDPIHYSAVMGNIMHKVMQECLRKYVPYNGERLDMKTEIDETIQSSSLSLFECDKTEADAHEFVQQRMGHVATWLNLFATPRGRDPERQVLDVVDIEECIWAPQYGLKGRVDASLAVRSSRGANSGRRRSSTVGSALYPGHPPAGALSDSKTSQETSHQLYPSGPPTCRQPTVVPMEFKTGKPYFTHRAQLLLYLLLMETRYDKEIESGLLWYAHRPEEMETVKMRKADMDAVIQARNHLAYYLKHQQLQLPPMIMNPRSCQRCPFQAGCATLHKLMENGNEATSGMGDDFEELTAHLGDAHRVFLLRWLEALDCEYNEASRKLPFVWHPDEDTCREAGVPGLRQLILQEVSKDGVGWVYTFSDLQGQETFAVDDFVIVSVENDQVGIFKGHIQSATQKAIAVFTDVVLPKRWHARHHRWRLNKYYSSKSANIQRSNLMALVTSQEPKISTLRELIIDLKPPISVSHLQTPLEQRNQVLTECTADLNDDQTHAVERILDMPQYCLVHGMPGSGKTSTIVQAIKALVAMGRSVLVSSYTHSAVDNILARLKAVDVDFIRIGTKSAVHRDIYPYTLGGDGRFQDTSTASLTALMQEIKVVGVSCLGVQHSFLKRMRFDVCVVDEACQIVLPSLLGPLLLADCFVLVGDPMQLPPLITSQKALDLKMDESLFSILQEAHPEAVVQLSYQYRMCRGVMELANHLVYNHQLRCGSQEIANQHLKLPDWPQTPQRETITWLAADPGVQLLFLDSSEVQWLDTKDSGSYYNRREARMIAWLARDLRLYGLPEQDLGVISPYNSQNRYIQTELEKDSVRVDVSTVDKFQGRDKQCILVSFVRSNAEKETGPLLADWRRVNVAMTRARAKLILVGDAQTLQSDPFLAKAIQYLTVGRLVWTLQKPNA